MTVFDFNLVRECFIELDKALSRTRRFSPPERADNFQLLWTESTPTELVFQHKTCSAVRVVFHWRTKKLEVLS